MSFPAVEKVGAPWGPWGSVSLSTPQDGWAGPDQEILSQLGGDSACPCWAFGGQGSRWGHGMQVGGPEAKPSIARRMILSHGEGSCQNAPVENRGTLRWSRCSVQSEPEPARCGPSGVGASRPHAARQGWRCLEPQPWGRAAQRNFPRGGDKTLCLCSVLERPRPRPRVAVECLQCGRCD